MFKKSFSKMALIIAALLAILFMAYWYSFSALSNTSSNYTMEINTPFDDTSFGGIFYSPIINDSLPYYKYRIIEDSVKRKKDIIRLNNESTGEGMLIGNIGVRVIKRAQKTVYPLFSNNPSWEKISDSLNYLNSVLIRIKNNDSEKIYKAQIDELLHREQLIMNSSINISDSNNLYYFSLGDYNLNEDTKFFIKNDTTYNLAYVVWDTLLVNKYDSIRKGHYLSKPISVRYSTPDKKILIPISKRQYNFLSTLLNITIFIMLFLYVYFFIGLPIQIIYSISKGKAFITQNVYRFKQMALFSLVIGIIGMTLPYFFHLLFHKRIPPDFTLPPFISVFLFTNALMLFLALVLGIIARAFKKGYQLQQENDLTV